MKAFVIALVLLMVSGEALAVGSAWHGKRVRVYNHAGVEWAPYLKQSIAHTNRTLPKKAPRFRYRQAGPECRSHRRAITVCTAGDMDAFGETVSTVSGHRLWNSRIWLRPFAEYTEPLVIACHELFHATTGIGSHGAWTQEADCPYDERAARRVYRRYGAH